MLNRRTMIAAGLCTLADQGHAAGPDAASRLRAAARRAQARADGLLRGQGLTDGPVGVRLAALAKDPRWLHPDSDAGRDRAVADMNARLAALKPALEVAFGDLPIPAAQVRRMSAADEAAGRGGYRVAPTGGEPGAYYVDLHAIRSRPAWTLPSVAFHEVIPGHLLQLSLQAFAHAPQARVKAAGPYFEGWATYAEQLAADLGAYAGDPLGELGYLHERLFRLARGIVDVGLRDAGWSRPRAAAEMRALQGFDAAFVTIEADVDRIATAPGKVAAEALGALDLAAWRPRERRRWPAYHRAVLAEGPWPFDELRGRIQAPLIPAFAGTGGR